MVAGLAAMARSLCFAQFPGDMQLKFDEAERRIARLSPAAFRRLPTGVVRELQRRSSTIPQEAFTAKANNVIRGRVRQTGPNGIGPSCARSKASPRSSFSGTARRRTPPLSRGRRTASSFKGWLVKRSGSPEVLVPLERTSSCGAIAHTGDPYRRRSTIGESTTHTLGKRR